MALQIRRGTSGTLTGIVPAAGELIYTTDTKLVYVGDGSTAGGTAVSGGGSNDIVNDTTPQLGGNLDVNGRSIVSASNGNIIIAPNGTGTILLNGNITKIGELNISPTTRTLFGNSTAGIDGNVAIIINTYSSTDGFLFSQHHATADAVNFKFLRTRGTELLPTAVLNGDGLGDIVYSGHDGTNSVACAAFKAVVDGVPTLNNIPTKFILLTNNGSSTATRAELSSSGIWKVNGIENFSGTDLTLTATTVKVVGNVQINAQGDLRFADADSSNYVAFQAPAVVSSNITWTLPNTTGDSGQVLTAAGSGTLQWSVPLASTAPLTATSAGTVGQIAFDASYIYVCVASGTWVRAVLATWS